VSLVLGSGTPKIWDLFLELGSGDPKTRYRLTLKCTFLVFEGSENPKIQGDFFDCALGIGVLQGLFWH
jgi:hypothetical protein